MRTGLGRHPGPSRTRLGTLHHDYRFTQVYETSSTFFGRRGKLYSGFKLSKIFKLFFTITPDFVIFLPTTVSNVTVKIVEKMMRINAENQRCH